MKVAIVILNYNGRKFLEKFLPIVVANSPEGNIIVADNASTDSSIEFLQLHFPQIQTIQLATNLGYAGGYNAALKQIEADWYVLMNSDIAPKAQWLGNLIQYLEANPNIKAAQPFILKENNPTEFEYAGAAGGYLDYLGYPFCRGRIFDTTEPNLNQYKSTSDLHWATGACLMVESKTYWEVGGLDEYLFAHQEEIDLCCRIKRAGYQIAAVADSLVLHVGGGTLQAENPQKTFLNFRNNLILLYKNFDSKLPLLFFRLILDGIAGIKYASEGKFAHVWAIIKAHFGFYYYLLFVNKQVIFPLREKIRTYPHAIIWQYFIKKRKRFSELP